MNNAIYWLVNPLDEDTLRILRRIKDGLQPFSRNRFEVAHLVALECVEADCDARLLTVTDKGLDALEYYDES